MENQYQGERNYLGVQQAFLTSKKMFNPAFVFLVSASYRNNKISKHDFYVKTFNRQILEESDGNSSAGSTAEFGMKYAQREQGHTCADL